MSPTYAIRYAHGAVEYAETYEEALDLVLAFAGPDVEIGHDGDIAQGGERTLFWRDAETAANDDGSRALGAIQLRHAQDRQ